MTPLVANKSEESKIPDILKKKKHQSIPITSQEKLAPKLVPSAYESCTSTSSRRLFLPASAPRRFSRQIYTPAAEEAARRRNAIRRCPGLLSLSTRAPGIHNDRARSRVIIGRLQGRHIKPNDLMPGAPPPPPRAILSFGLLMPPRPPSLCGRSFGIKSRPPPH